MESIVGKAAGTNLSAGSETDCNQAVIWRGDRSGARERKSAGEGRRMSHEEGTVPVMNSASTTTSGQATVHHWERSTSFHISAWHHFCFLFCQEQLDAQVYDEGLCWGCGGGDEKKTNSGLILSQISFLKTANPLIFVESFKKGCFGKCDLGFFIKCGV